MAGNDEEPLIDKPQLLRWASETSGVTCRRFEDLRDGSVILRLFATVFPGVVSLNNIKWAPFPATEADEEQNWTVIQRVSKRIGLPMEAVDKRGVRRARFTPCWHLLATLFFLHNLSLRHDFAVDFKHPIDKPVAAFLQSTASIDVLTNGGAVGGQSRRHDSGRVASVIGGPDRQASSAGGPDSGRFASMMSVRSKQSMGGMPDQDLHEEGLVPAASIRTVPPSVEAPHAEEGGGAAVGQEVETTAAVSGTVGAGQRGRVVGQWPSEDGPRLLVDFGSPRRTLLLRPSNIRAVSATLPPVGATVEAVNMDAQPELAGAIGTVTGQRPARDGIRVLVRFNPQGLMMVRPANLRVLNTGGEESAPRVVEGGEVSAMDLEMGRLMSYDSRRPPQESPAPGVEGAERLWRDPKSRRKGEAVVAELRLELESTRRKLALAEEQVAAARREAAGQTAAARLAIRQAQVRAEEQSNAQVALAEAKAREELLAAQANFSAELRRVAAEVRFETERARGGYDAPVEALEAELLRMRQQRLSHEPLLAAADTTNASLRELLRKHEEVADLYRQQHQNAQERCAAIVEALLLGGSEGPPPTSTGSDPLTVLLSDMVPEDVAQSAALEYAQQQQQKDGTARADLLALTAKLQELRRKLQASNASQGNRAAAPQRAGGGDCESLLREYDTEQRATVAEGEIKRLQEEIAFFKERDSRAIGLGSEGDETGRVPTLATDELCGRVLEMLRTGDIRGLERLFWTLVADQCMMQAQMHRVSESSIMARAQLSSAAERARADTERAVEQATAAAERRSRECKAAAADLAAEKAGTEVALRLAEEQLAEARDELLSAARKRSAAVALAEQHDDERFKELASRLRVAVAGAARAKLREGLLLHLCGTYRDLATVGAGREGGEARRQRLEMDAESTWRQLQQLPALPSGEDAANMPGDVLETLVSEATSRLRSQVESAAKDSKVAQERAVRLGEQLRGAEASVCTLRAQLGETEQRRSHAEHESDSLHQELKAMREAEHSRAAALERERDRLAGQVQRLEDQIHNLPLYEEVRQLLCKDPIAPPSPLRPEPSRLSPRGSPRAKSVLSPRSRGASKIRPRSLLCSPPRADSAAVDVREAMAAVLAEVQIPVPEVQGGSFRNTSFAPNVAPTLTAPPRPSPDSDLEQTIASARRDLSQRFGSLLSEPNIRSSMSMYTAPGGVRAAGTSPPSEEDKLASASASFPRIPTPNMFAGEGAAAPAAAAPEQVTERSGTGGGSVYSDDDRFAQRTRSLMDSFVSKASSAIRRPDLPCR
eukprot:Hpha_TRINITY_DN15296_c3_g6::TRINITY_DN15296_c3_g6_i1::g.66237::m.66237